MINLKWDAEPDLDQLRRLHALLAENPAEALPGLEALGERGSVASALYLADFHMKEGRSPVADKSKAEYWYKIAHEKGCAEASYMLGRLYSQSHRYDLAFAAFSKGAESGYLPAIYRLAKSYQRGEGTPRNTVEYKRLLELAYSKGHIFAKRDLAALLLSGRFGWRQAVKGVLLLFSLWGDLAKAVKRGSTTDERVLA